MIDARQPARAQQAWRHFVETPLDKLLEPGETADAAQRALELFREVAADVPAYGAFLAESGIDPRRIATPADLPRLPLLTKANYVRRYPLAERVRGGRLAGCDMIAVSSGSTGEPTFWPRFQSDEAAIAVRFEQVFADGFLADRRRTLAVICFALGSWVGGLYTLGCCRLLAAKGYPILCVAPGNNKAEIWRVVQALGSQFDQTVLLGYPPFLKDVIDGGIVAGIDWRPLKVKLVMAGEVFSEEWRSLVGSRLGSTAPCYDQASLYGTADAGVLGNETPLSIAIRRFLAETPKAARALFGESRLLPSCSTIRRAAISSSSRTAPSPSPATTASPSSVTTSPIAAASRATTICSPSAGTGASIPWPPSPARPGAGCAACPSSMCSAAPISRSPISAPISSRRT